jgi:hypothetical protein
MRDQDTTLDRLFEAGRSVERGPSTERDRLRGAVASRLAAVGVISTSAAMTAKAVAGTLEFSGTSTLLGLAKGKLALVLVAIAFAGTVSTLLIVSAPPNEVEDADAVRAVASAAPLQPIDVTALSGPVVLPPVPSVPNGSVSSQPTASRIASARPEHSGLAEELASVRSAQGALAAGEASRALKLIDSYFRRFPGGVLLPEAKATQIRALCQAGLGEQANRQAELFEVAHRDSPLAVGHKLRCNSASK